MTDKTREKRTTMARRPDPENRSKGKKTSKDGGSHASKESESRADKQGKLAVLCIYSYHINSNVTTTKEQHEAKPTARWDVSWGTWEHSRSKLEQHPLTLPIISVYFVLIN